MEIRGLNFRHLAGFCDRVFLMVAHPRLIIVLQEHQRVPRPVPSDRRKECRALVRQDDVPRLVAFGLQNGNGPAIRIEIGHGERAQFAISRPGFQSATHQPLERRQARG